MSSRNSTEQDNLCVVCFKNFETYSIGVCDHAVCFECSTRMRVLCKQNECPICRGEMQKVIFTHTRQPFSELFAKFERSNMLDRRYGIYFCTSDIQKSYQNLLEHRCTICTERNANHWPFKTFNQLKDHMRREHELFYCDICVENLKIFTFERRSYNRQELATHRRKGDKDNTSHRGHPLCEFCDTRYMDNDELFRHLRRNHLFCHFCDADGKYQYYNSIEDMKRHFREEHFLCEEGECRTEPLTAAFRTDIDLKVHIATEHGKNMSKTATKMARTLELEFTLMPRSRAMESGKNFKSGRYRGDQEDEPGGASSSRHVPEPVSTTAALTPQDFPALGNSTDFVPLTTRAMKVRNFMSKLNPSLNSSDFPSLGGSTAPAVTITASASNNRATRAPEVTVTRTMRPQPSGGRLVKSTENFPPLGGATGSSTVHLSLNSQDSVKSPKVSIHVNHKPNGTISTHITTTSAANVQPKSTEAFPALGKASSSNAKQPQWVVASKVKKPEPAKVNKVAPAPQLPPSDLSQFPTLSKSKKTSPTNETAVSSTWINLNSLNTTKQPPKVEKKATISTNENGTKASGKSKKKKNKNTTNNNNNNNLEEECKGQQITPNNTVKKRSELKIGTLSSSQNEQVTKPPPGFNVKPPPGFTSDVNSASSFPSLSNANDLTFTNSSGQSYAITPTTNYRQPANFAQRNQQLIKKLMNLMNNKNDAIIEFKKWSEAFRNGTFPAEQYYEYCKGALEKNFEEVFNELLVLLPDIEKQRQLYDVYVGKTKGQPLVTCENCKQVIFKRELSDHYNYHTLDNHFPSLGKATQVNNVWKK